ncbi:MAG: hemerythrin domain-containing protein [Burkholderiales bacterium]
MTVAIPLPLKKEHNELHEELVRATKEPGAVGEAAKKVARLLHPHFVSEEEYALPPLGLLAAVARGETPAEAGQGLAMAERLRKELPRMLQEHGAIVEALAELSEAAQRESKAWVVRFAENLTLHAQTEEEVLYPATLVLGEILRRRGVKG